MIDNVMLASVCAWNSEEFIAFGFFILFIAIVFALIRICVNLMKLPTIQSQQKLMDTIVEELKKNREEVKLLSKEINELKNKQ